MKNYLKIKMIIALLFGTIVMSASEPILKVDSKIDSKSLIFELNSKSAETLLTFYDTDSNIIFSDNIFDAIYAKKFDLKNLEVGNYTFKVENNMTTYVYSINVAEGSVDILKIKKNRKPIFRKSDSMVFINLLNLDNKDVKIQVSDSSNRLVSEEIVSNELVVQRAFNFKNATADGYTIAIKNGDDVYYEAVVVN